MSGKPCALAERVRTTQRHASQLLCPLLPCSLQRSWGADAHVQPHKHESYSPMHQLQAAQHKQPTAAATHIVGAFTGLILCRQPGHHLLGIQELVQHQGTIAVTCVTRVCVSVCRCVSILRAMH